MVAPREKRATLETEATSFLLFVAGAFFLLEGLVHYEDFFVTSRADNSVSIVLVVGSVVVALFYLLLAYSCWKNPANNGYFGTAMVMSVITFCILFCPCGRGIRWPAVLFHFIFQPHSISGWIRIGYDFY